MIRAVIFDLDGTFIDSTPAIVESFEYSFERLDIDPPPRQRVIDTIGHTLEDQFALFTERDPEECTRVYRERYAEIAVAKTQLLPGAVESAARFREAGLLLGVATSKKLEYAELILDHFGVLDWFDVRTGPYQVSKPKPHPECLHKTMAGLGVSAHETFYIGDTDFDVKAAKAANVRCLAVTTGYNTREALEALGPELVADHLDEVTEYVLANLGTGRS